MTLAGQLLGVETRGDASDISKEKVVISVVRLKEK
jgi:hypothetical protein